MKENKKEIKKRLEILFPESKIIDQEYGFRLDIHSLNKLEMDILSSNHRIFDIKVKRSGKGLALFIQSKNN